MSHEQELSSLSYTECLGFGDLEAMLALQDSLPEECYQFLKIREREDLEAHLSAGMPIIGVWDDDHLVAYALLTYPDLKEHAKFLEGYPEDPNAAILQSVVSTQKGGLTLLLNKAKELTTEKGLESLYAKVNAANENGLHAFGKRGFETVQVGTDPVKGYSAHFMQAVISPETQLSEGLSQPAQDLPGYQFLKEEHPQESVQAQL